MYTDPETGRLLIFCLYSGLGLACYGAIGLLLGGR